MDWGNLVGTLFAAGSGGITGILGSLAGVWVKKKQAEQELIAKQAEWAQEIKLHELQQKDKSMEAQANLDITNTKGSWDGLSTSLQAARGGASPSQWVTDCKSMFRPVLTLLLWGLAIAQYYSLDSIALDSNILFSKVEMIEVYRYMVYTIFYAASTATLWWFGDRAFAPPGLKHK